MAKTYNKVKIIYLINGIGKIGQICAKMKIDYLLTQFMRINSSPGDMDQFGLSIVL